MITGVSAPPAPGRPREGPPDAAGDAGAGPAFRQGQVLGGKYHLLRRLGAGAMGEVWEAEHASLRARVALKLVDTRRGPSGAEVKARFLHEARAASRVSSPNVVRILDHGEDGAAVFLAMELLRGEGLDARIARGKLGPKEATFVLGQVALALEAAHAEGIVHRDLKPANVFLVDPARAGEGRTVRVLDFGIAKTLTQADEPLIATKAGYVLGTPVYMSPEQIVGSKVDGRSDVWQLGVLAYECLTGSLPFSGATMGDVFVRVCTADLPVPSERARDLTPAFDAWFRRACARRPQDRFASALEAASELADALGTRADLVPGAWLATSSTQLPRARRRSLLFVGVGTGVLLGGALLAAAVLAGPPFSHSGRAPRAAEAAPAEVHPSAAPPPRPSVRPEPRESAPPEPKSPPSGDLDQAAPRVSSSLSASRPRPEPIRRRPVRPEDEIGL